MKKIVFLLVMIILGACSKDNGTAEKYKPLPGLAAGKYLLTTPDDTQLYQSEIVNIIEIDGNIMTYTLGVLNDYRKDKDGNPRAGNHSDPKFLVNSSVYELAKENNQIKFKFIASSCSDETLNPHSAIIPQISEAFYQINNKLLMRMDNEIVEFFKEESKVLTLNSISTRVLCNGEVEND